MFLYYVQIKWGRGWRIVAYASTLEQAFRLVDILITETRVVDTASGLVVSRPK